MIRDLTSFVVLTRICCLYIDRLDVDLGLLLLSERFEAKILSLNEIFEVQEGLLELFEDFRRAVAIARSVVLRIHRVHNDKDGLALGCLGVEGPTTSHIVQLALIPTKLFQ